MHFIEHENHLFTLSYCNSWCWWYIGRIATIIITIIVDMLSLLHIRSHQNLFSLRLITSSVHEPEFYPLTNNDNSKQKLPHRTTQIIEGISHFEFFLVGMYLSIILLPVFGYFLFRFSFILQEHNIHRLLCWFSNGKESKENSDYFVFYRLMSTETIKIYGYFTISKFTELCFNTIHIKFSIVWNGG